MGYYVRGICHKTLTEAQDTYFSTTGPFYTAGSTSYHAWFERSGSVWQLKRQSVSSSGSVTNLATTNAVSPAFPVCDDAANFVSGLELGWGVASVLVAAWSIRFLARALSR